MQTALFKPRYACWLLAAAMIAILALGGVARAHCPEPPETEEGGRKGLSRRNFIKRLAHEINLLGGVYANEVMGAALLAGVSYSFHVSEDLALEAGLSYAKFNSKMTRPIEDYSGLLLLESHDARIYSGNLVWHPFHGKFMFFNAAIPHFDFYLTAGIGVTDSRVSRGLTYNAGVGMKIFCTSWLTIRFDVRDYLYVQDIVASESITNNLALTAGVGFWFPFERQ